MSDIFTGERNTSRVLAAPGGKQSINIFGGGGDEDEAPAKKPRAEPPVAAKPTETMAAGGRVVQNTEYTGISERSSTRLHAPPGGKQSINIFGGGGDEDEQDAAPETERQAPPAKEVAAPVAEPPIPAKPTQPATMAAGGRVAQNTEHTGIADKPSTRVHAPPGGASSMSSVFSQDVVSGSAADRMAALRSRRQESGTAWQARPF